MYQRAIRYIIVSTPSEGGGGGGVEKVGVGKFDKTWWGCGRRWGWYFVGGGWHLLRLNPPPPPHLENIFNFLKVKLKYKTHLYNKVFLCIPD